MIVCKLGGTSVQDAEALERAAGISQRRLKDRPVVVTSAMGKTTDSLLSLAEAAAKGKRQEALDLLHKIKDKHLKEAQKVLSGSSQGPVLETINMHFKEMSNLVKGLAIIGELTPRSMDAISSF